MGRFQSEVSCTSMTYLLYEHPANLLSDQPPDWVAELNESNLYNFVTTGPDQCRRVLDSPMLGLAQERQFAISQLGTRSVGFEAEHRAQIEEALRLINDRFARHRLDEREPCRPISPYSEDVGDLRVRSYCFSPLPILDMSQLSTSTFATTSPARADAKPGRSSLPLNELMNPAPPPTLKRKASDEGMAYIVADDVESEPHVDDHVLFDHTPPLTYPQVRLFGGNIMGARTQKGVRMRRARSAARHRSSEPPDVGQLEKDGQLLLNLSRRRLHL